MTTDTRDDPAFDALHEHWIEMVMLRRDSERLMGKLRAGEIEENGPDHEDLAEYLVKLQKMMAEHQRLYHEFVAS